MRPDCRKAPQGSGSGFKGTGCKAPRERHCKRKNVPKRRQPLGRKSAIADITSVRRQVTNEERTLCGASQKTCMKEDHQQRALSPWCMDGRSVRRRFPEREGPVFFCRGLRWPFSGKTEADRRFFCVCTRQAEAVFPPPLSIRAGGGQNPPASSLFLGEWTHFRRIGQGSLTLFSACALEIEKIKKQEEITCITKEA